MIREVLSSGFMSDSPCFSENRLPIAGFIQVALAATIWGAAYPLTKGVLHQVPPLLLATGRFAIAATVLMLFTRSLPLAGIERRRYRSMFGLAFWGTFFLVVTMNFGLRWAPATASAILSGTPPLFTVVLAALWLGEPLQRRHPPALLAAMAGIALLTGESGSAAAGWQTWAGCLLVLAAQVSWAVYSVLGKEILATYPWPMICRDTFALGTLMLAPFALAEWLLQGHGEWNAASFGVLLYLGIANSVVTYGLWNRSLTMIPVTTASFILYLQPISGAVLGHVLFGDSLGMAGWAGSVLIFAALTAVLWPDKQGPLDHPQP